MADPKIRITADTSQAERAIANLESALEGINKASNAAGIALGAITAAATGVAVAFKGVTDQVGALADLGKVLGVSAQSLLALQRSAQLAGIDAGELNMTLMRLRGNLGEALVKGAGSAKDAFDRLGLSLEEVSRLPADQQIAKVTEALRGVQNPAERSALAIDLLGKQGPRMLEVADNAARLAEQAERMGIALSDIDVRNLEKAGDAIDEISFIAKDTLNKALAELAPYVIALKDSFVSSIDEAGGLGNVITGKLIPAMKLAAQAAGAFAAIFIAGKITAAVIAIVSAVIRMYQAIKLATTAAAALNAVMGKNPILKIVGAIAGLVGAAVVVNEIGDAFDELDKKAKEISANTQQELAAEKAAREQNTAEVNKLNEAKSKALKTLEQTIVKLEQSAQFEREKVDLGETQANINKVIREENEKLKEVGLSLTQQQKQRITDAYLSLEATKQEVSLTKTLEGLQTEIVSALIEDKNQRQIILAIRAKELEFGRSLTDSERERLTATIQTLQAIQQEQTIKTALKNLDNERLLLAVADKDEREVQKQILQIQEQIGRSLNEGERERLSNSIKLTQQAREQAAIQEAITNYTRQQTDLEKINRGLQLQKTLGGGIAGGVTSSKEFEKDLEALQILRDKDILSESEFLRQKEELRRQYNQKVLDLELKRIEQVLMAEKGSMAAIMSEQDRAILQQVGAQERQRKIVQERIEFEKKSDLDKTKFAIDNLGTVFGALASQNKKAFEANKALAIASALVNTYQGATKALATYPWPFGLIAAAAAVASGLAQVAAIRSQQYSGRQLGGPVMAGRPYIVGENGPELFTPNSTGSITRNGDLGGGGAVNVNFTIVANDTQGFDQLLTSRKGVITQIISDAMLERGQRSMV